MKELAYVLKFFLSLPLWLKAVLYILITAVVVAIAGYFGVRYAIIALIVMAAIVLLWILFSLIGNWVRARKAEELQGGIDLSLRRKPDPVTKARIDALEKRFFAGFDKLQVGRNIYEQPWFIVIGEPGAGKTEAIRGAALEAPQGLHDPDQGRGGTQMLDWWFTNFAVLLDTAGSLLFGRDENGVSVEWQHLLTLLAKYRHASPLNGIVVCIPMDLLVRDTERKIDAKAGTLARHLDAVQSILGIRVPVYLIITKSDELPGFEAFFEHLHDARATQQLIGWTNPAALEAPIRPEMITEEFRTISARLRRRRLALLADPAPNVGGRRLDEVDGLFDFPAAVVSFLPGLHRYVEALFAPGEWSKRPLFLRGVYATSAKSSPPTNTPTPSPDPATLRNPALGSWYRTQSYFLRDIFLDKVFREDGLIRPAGDSNAAVLRRRIATFLLGVCVLLAFFGAALVGYRQLSQVAAPQMAFWDIAAGSRKAPGNFPIVTDPQMFSALATFNGDNTVKSLLHRDLLSHPRAEELTLVQLQRATVEMTSIPFRAPFIYRPLVFLGTSPAFDRFQAQRIIFENSVVSPLLTQTRQKMAPTAPSNQPSDPRPERVVLAIEARALAELVRVEVARVGRTEGKFTEKPGDDFIGTLLEYTTGRSSEPMLVDAMNWTYGKNPFGKNQWAPDWTTGGLTLAQNVPINVGIDRLIAYVNANVGKVRQQLAAIQSLAATVRSYQVAEAALAKAAAVRDDPTAEAAVANAFEALEAAKVTMEQQLLAARNAGMFEGRANTLTSALDGLADGKESHLGQVDVIINMINEVLPPPPPAGQQNVLLPSRLAESKFRLLNEIKTRLEGVAKTIDDNLQNVVTDQLRSDYASLDQLVLDPYQDIPSYLWRWNNYQLSADAASDYHFNTGMYLVNERWEQLGAFLGALASLQTQVDRYTGSNAQNFITICNFFLARAANIQTALFTSSYIRQARDALLRVARFPLVWPPGSDAQALDPDQLRGARDLLNAIAQDIAAPVFVALPVATKQPVLDFAKRVQPLQAVTAALIKPDGSMPDVSVTLFNGQAQKQLSGPNFSPLPSPSPSPTPPPRSLMSKLFFGIGSPPPDPPPPPSTTINLSNWNAVEILNPGSGGIYPLDSPSDTLLAVMPIQDGFSFRVYHSMMASDGSEAVPGGGNWSALRLIARLNGQPVGTGQDWRVALRPNEPNSVWIRFTFDIPLPTTPWPTLASIGLSPLSTDPTQPPTPAQTPAPTTQTPSP